MLSNLIQRSWIYRKKNKKEKLGGTKVLWFCLPRLPLSILFYRSINVRKSILYRKEGLFKEQGMQKLFSQAN